MVVYVGGRQSRRKGNYTMTKHLEAFIACNSLANAKRIAAHARKHPFALCLLTADHAHLVEEAIRLAERG